MKQNLASVQQGNLPLQQQSRKIAAQSYQGVQETLLNKGNTNQDKKDMKINIGDAYKYQDSRQLKPQIETWCGQSRAIDNEDYDEDEPVQINLYSQKNFSIDRISTENSRDQDPYQLNQNNNEKKFNSVNTNLIQSKVNEKSNSKNGQLSPIIVDPKQLPSQFIKSQSPKEGVRNSKVFQANQGGSNKHNNSNNYIENKQETFSTSVQSAYLNSNSSSLIDQYKLKYLQEVEKTLSNNTQISQSNQNDDILSQKMQLIEQKKKKIFQQANADIKSLKIPLVSQSMELSNKYPINKKNAKTQIAHKKRMSLREQSKRRKLIGDRKNQRLNKSMKASRLSASFDLYCIYESKSEDSNDCSPQESRNRSFFFKSEKILNQLGLPSAPTSPIADKKDEIIDNFKIEKENNNLITSSSRNEKPQIKAPILQNNPVIQKKGVIKKDVNSTNSTEEQDNTNTQDNSVSTPINLKAQPLIKNVEDFSNKNNDSSTKSKKYSLSKQTSAESSSVKASKNIATSKKNIELSSSVNKANIGNSSGQSTIPLNGQQSQNRQNSQPDRKENLRGSLIGKQEQNNKGTENLKDKQIPAITTTTIQSQALLKKDQPQLIIYDLKNPKNSSNEKQQNQVKIKIENEGINQPQVVQTEKQLQVEVEEKNEIKQSRSSSLSDTEDNFDNSPKGFNIINLYRKSNSQQDVPASVNQEKDEQDEILQKDPKQNNNNYPIKKRNSSLSNLSSVQHINGFVVSKIDASSNQQSSQSIVKISQSLLPPSTAYGANPVSKVKEYRFMTEEEGTPQQSENYNATDYVNQMENFSLNLATRQGMNDKQILKQDSIKDSMLMRREAQQPFKYQSDRVQIIQFDKKNSRQGKGEGSQNTSLKGRRNSIGQIQAQNITNQNGSSHLYGVSSNYPATIINSPTIPLGIKKSESQQTFQTSTYRDQFKQKLELKSAQIQNQAGYNIAVYIQNNSKQFGKQSSQSPKGNRMSQENYESIVESQCNSPKDVRSDKLRSNMSCSSINKSKANSDLNSPELRGQQQKIIDQNKLKIIKLQQKATQYNLANKNQKIPTQYSTTDQEVAFDLNQKGNTNDNFYRKPTKPSPSRNANLWSPDSQGRQISQLDTQVSHLLSTKTNHDTETSNTNDNGKLKKNIQVSEFYKDFSIPLQLGVNHAHSQAISLPQSLNQSAKNDRYKNIKEEIEKISSANSTSVKSQQTHLQPNNNIMSPFWGSIDLKKQTDGTGKKEIVIKPLHQDSSQQKLQYKKNKFNVESKVKSYIQAGQLSQQQLKVKDQPNFHLAKGAGIQIQNQQNNSLNSKSLHQESMDTGRYMNNQCKESRSMFTTYEMLGNSSNNGTYIDNNQTSNTSDLTEKNFQFSINSHTASKHVTKEDLKQSIQQSMNAFSQTLNPVKVVQNQQSLGELETPSQLSPVEYLTQIQQQMQMQRQLAAEQLQKAQLSINQIQQSIDMKSVMGNNNNLLIQNTNNRGSQLSNK